MSSDKRQRQRGTTLLESLVALALFGIASAAIGTLLTQHIRTQGSNMTQTTAIAIASRELEDLRSLDYDDIVSRSSTQVFGGLTYTLTTAVADDVPAAKMKSITATVTWTEANGPQTYTLDAIYTAVKR
jgi:prepilin-type N-terminal cleavage/methylation domain-containing protein